MTADRRAGFKLFIGGLTSCTKDKDLKEYFGQYGNLTDFVVIERAGQKRGFGFVSFERMQDRNKCLNELPHTLDGKKVEVKRAIPKDDDKNRTNRMYVKGLPLDATDNDVKVGLEEIGFEGRIERVQIMTEKETNKSRGFAFVTLKESEDVDDMLVLKKFNVMNRLVIPEKAKSREQIDEETSRTPRYYRDSLGTSRRSSYEDDRYGYSSRRYGGRDDYYDDRHSRGGYSHYSSSGGSNGGYMDSCSYSDSRGPAPSYTSGGYGGSQSHYNYESSAHGHSHASAGSAAMASYSQSTSSYGPSRGSLTDRAGSQGFHPYSRR